MPDKISTALSLIASDLDVNTLFMITMYIEIMLGLLFAGVVFLMILFASSRNSDAGEIHFGDKVAIVESRPMSKRKRWVVTRVVTKALAV